MIRHTFDSIGTSVERASSSKCVTIPFEEARDRRLFLPLAINLIQSYNIYPHLCHDANNPSHPLSTLYRVHMLAGVARMTEGGSKRDLIGFG